MTEATAPDDDELNGDYFTAKRKIRAASEWRGTANAPLGDTTAEFGIRLLDEDEFEKVKDVIPIQELQQKFSQSDDGSEDIRERLMELQQKEDLTDEEEEEFRDLLDEVQERDMGIEDEFGMEAYRMLMWAGKQAVVPTEGDVSDVLNMGLERQRDILGSLPDHLNRETVRNRLKGDMVDTIDGQPFPIKKRLGLQTFFETIKVRGNGLDQTE